MSTKMMKTVNADIFTSLNNFRIKINQKMEKIEEKIIDSFDSIPASGQLKFYETAVRQTESNRDQILKTVIGTLENAKRKKERDSKTRANGEG